MVARKFWIMTNTEIFKIIKQGENQTVEFKSSFQKETSSSVVAFQGNFASQSLFASFANTKGGKIFAGISDSKEIILNPTHQTQKSNNNS